MKFLRLSSMSVRQIIILHCNDEVDELLASGNFTVLGAPHTRLDQMRVLENDCLVSLTEHINVYMCAWGEGGKGDRMFDGPHCLIPLTLSLLWHC